MGRTRISTTVDADVLQRCRDAFGLSDSELLDRALGALWREVVGDQERDAIADEPYEDDPDLSWQAPPGPDLPYDGAVPEEVRRLAAERRARYQA